MALYDENGIKISKAKEKAFMDKWEVDGLNQPRTTPFKDGHRMLSALEISDIIAEWGENKRPRTPQELDDALEEEVQLELNLTPKTKVILKQLFLLRKVTEPTLTEDAFFSELKTDYKTFKG